MITQMKLAEQLYKYNPSEFEDRVDGICEMPWAQAMVDMTIEYRIAMAQSTVLMTALVQDSSFSSEEIGNAKKIAKTLETVGLLGPSRGGIAKVTADLMCDGSQIISALLIELDRLINEKQPVRSTGGMFQKLFAQQNQKSSTGDDSG